MCGVWRAGGCNHLISTWLLSAALSPPAGLNDARRPPSTHNAHSTPFNSVSVRLVSLKMFPYERRVCLRVPCRQGRAESERAREVVAGVFRGDRARDDGR